MFVKLPFASEAVPITVPVNPSTEIVALKTIVSAPEAGNVNFTVAGPVVEKPYRPRSP